MTKQLKCYYLLLIRHYKLSLLNQFLAGFSIMAVWGNNFFLLFFSSFFFTFPLKCHWPIWASSLKSHSPAGRIHSPLATGRMLMKRLSHKLNYFIRLDRVITFWLNLLALRFIYYYSESDVAPDGFTENATECLH